MLKGIYLLWQSMILAGRILLVMALTFIAIGLFSSLVEGDTGSFIGIVLLSPVIVLTFMFGVEPVDDMVKWFKKRKISS